MNQQKRIVIEATMDGQMVVGIRCSRILPIDAFIEAMAKAGYETVQRTKPPEGEAQLVGELIHVTGPEIEGKAMRKLVGKCKVQVLGGKPDDDRSPNAHRQSAGLVIGDEES